MAALFAGLIQPGATAQAASLGTAGLFVPVQGRLVSTLAGTGTTKAPLAANTPRTIQATGAAGLPSSGVAAILVTFTVVDPTSAGQASVGPTGGALSGAMRYVANEPTSNSAIVQLSATGQFQIQTTTQTNANIDIQGYYTSGSGTAAGGYVPLDYARTVNTNTGLGLPLATLAGGSTSTIQVSGTGDVPAGAAAVFVNFEVQNQNTTPGNITAYSASATRPTSTLQFGVGKTSLSTIVPLDANGKIKVFVSSGNTIDLLMDVEGYFTPGSTTSSSGSIFTPKTAKIYDTRGATPIAAGASVTIPVGGANGLPTVEQGLSAITANITAINTTTISVGSYARIYPSGEAEPQGVGVVFNSGPAGTATTNLATVAVGTDDAIVIHNVSSVAVDYILDLEGWYSSSSPDPTTPEVTGTGGAFVATAGRIPKTLLDANVPTPVQVVGLSGIPETGAGAVAVSVSIVSATTPGTLNAQATGDSAWSQVAVYGSVPAATTNTVVLALGDDGTITFQASSAVGIYLDIQGYYTSEADGTTAPGGFSPLSGSRLVDTRNGLGAPLAKIAPGGSVTVQVAGKAGVPLDAQAVVANFTVITQDTTGGYITPYPTGSTRPSLSMNYMSLSGTTAIGGQVALSADGKITVDNPVPTSSNIDLIIDIQGYFSNSDGTNGQFTPATGRLYDSRVSPNVAVGPDQTVTVPIGGQANVPSMPTGLTVVFALTVVADGTAYGYSRAWASGTSEPDPFSSINYPPNSVRTNTLTVPVGSDGAIKIHNVGNDTVDYILDLQGWYASIPASDGPELSFGWSKSDGFAGAYDSLITNNSGEAVGDYLDAEAASNPFDPARLGLDGLTTADAQAVLKSAADSARTGTDLDVSAITTGDNGVTGGQGQVALMSVGSAPVMGSSAHSRMSWKSHNVYTSRYCSVAILPWTCEDSSLSFTFVTDPLNTQTRTSVSLLEGGGGKVVGAKLRTVVYSGQTAISDVTRTWNTPGTGIQWNTPHRSLVGNTFQVWYSLTILVKTGQGKNGYAEWKSAKSGACTAPTSSVAFKCLFP